MSPAVPGRRRGKLRRSTVFSAIFGVVIGTALLGGGSAEASSHREAPLIAGDPKVDNTDVYAFVSPDRPDSVTLIANWLPFEEPNGGPNFYPFQDGARYDINIDNDGDAIADVVYRWKFTSRDARGGKTFLYNDGPVTSLKDPNLLFRQYFTLTRIAGGRTSTVASGPVAPSNVGPASMPNYGALRRAAITSVKGGGKTFAGQADDPFFLDLRVFDLLYGGDLSETGQDTVKGYNVNSVALQVPRSAVALKGKPGRNPVIGIWSSTSKRTLRLSPGQATAQGDYVQVSRLGNALVNEVVVPAGLKDAFNGLRPSQDAGIPQVVKRVTRPELAKRIEQIYGIPAPPTPRNDLVEIFLTGIAKQAPTLDGTKAPIQADLNSQILNRDANPARFRPAEMLRLNLAVPVTGTPNRLGVIGGDLQGYPNGRRLADDALDISLQAVEGAAVSGVVKALAAGDRVDANDRAFGTSFPYLALPNTVAVNTATGSTATSSGTSHQNGATGQNSSLRLGGSTTGANPKGDGTTELPPTRLAGDTKPLSDLRPITLPAAVLGLAAAFLIAGLITNRRRRASGSVGGR